MMNAGSLQELAEFHTGEVIRLERELGLLDDQFTADGIVRHVLLVRINQEKLAANEATLAAERAGPLANAQPVCRALGCQHESLWGHPCDRDEAGAYICTYEVDDFLGKGMA
jgi:hypothetical protein